METVYASFFSSPIGNILINALEKGVFSVAFQDESPDIVPKNTLSENEHTILCKQELKEYFDKKRTDFTVLLLPSGTVFQKTIWELLQKIPYGSTKTYSEVSIKYGNLKAIRAVGTANGANPIAILIPCHRVIGKDGKLVGYAGGIWRKEWLLKHEGATLF